jgi:hypothetical protein
MQVADMKFETEYEFNHMSISPDDKYILVSSNKKNIHCIYLDDPTNPILLYTA